MIRTQIIIRTTQYRGIAQSGSASALGAEGRGFKSLCPDQIFKINNGFTQSGALFILKMQGRGKWNRRGVHKFVRNKFEHCGLTATARRAEHMDVRSKSLCPDQSICNLGWGLQFF